MKKITAALALAALTLAAPAHADEASYLADLQAHGVPTGPFMTPIPAGYTICGQIRAGMSPASAVGELGWAAAWGPVIVSAAQHGLCPDTLR